MLLNLALPEFYRELVQMLKDAARTDLADQLSEAEIIGRCKCGAPDCATFYLKGGRDLNPVEENIIGIRHEESILLDAESGMVVLDIDNFGRITLVEVLNRDDVFQALKAAGFQ